jgi:hypothetical protein
MISKYYVYYDKKTGIILSVGNEANKSYEYGIESTWEEVENLINGTWLLKDFIVGYRRNPDGKSQLAVIPNSEQGYIFKNNIFEWITEPNEKAECTIIWNNKDKSWQFKLSEAVKTVYRDSLLTPRLVFFVTLETDFDFLIRTIFIETIDLFSSEYVRIPFESKVEHDIDKISISSKLVFKNYGLKVIHE